YKLSSHTDARGIKTNFVYNNDPLNRLQSVNYDMSNFGDTTNPVVSTPPVTYQYRPGPNVDVTQVQQVLFGAAGGGFPGGSQSLGYDGFGRLQSITQVFSEPGGTPQQILEYNYDSLNRLNQTKYPGQYGLPGNPRKSILRQFDAAGRLGGIKVDGNDYASNLQYNNASQLTSLNIGPSGTLQITETYVYDPLSGLLTSQTARRGAATPFFNLSYDYSRPGVPGTTGQLTRL